MGLLDKILTADYAAASSKQHDLPLNLHGFAEKYHFSKAILFSAENGYYYPISAVGMTAKTIIKAVFTTDFLDHIVNDESQWKCISGLTVGGFAQFFSKSDFSAFSQLHFRRFNTEASTVILMIADNAADTTKIDLGLNELCTDPRLYLPLENIEQEPDDTLPRITVDCSAVIEELTDSADIKPTSSVYAAVSQVLHTELYTLISRFIPQHKCDSYRRFCISFPLTREELDTISIDLLSFHMEKSLSSFWGCDLHHKPVITFIP